MKKIKRTTYWINKREGFVRSSKKAINKAPRGTVYGTTNVAGRRAVDAKVKYGKRIK